MLQWLQIKKRANPFLKEGLSSHVLALEAVGF